MQAQNIYSTTTFARETFYDILVHITKATRPTRNLQPMDTIDQHVWQSIVLQAKR